MTLAESIGLPPPMLMRVSIDGSLSTESVASSTWARGACWVILVKVPAWCLAPKNDSTWLMREVLVAREEPVMMKAFDEADGRREGRCFSTEEGP